MCSHSSMEWPCEVRRLTLHHRKHALEQEPKYCDVVRLGYVQPLLIEWLGEASFFTLHHLCFCSGDFQAGLVKNSHG